MNIRALFKRHAFLWLLLVAAVSTAAWRAEIMAHPQGITDLPAYTHWAIPFSVALFSGWLFLFAPVPDRRRRIGLLVAAPAAIAVCYPFAKEAIIAHFAHPWYVFGTVVETLGAFPPLESAPHHLLHLLRLCVFWGLYCLIVLTPVLFALLLRLFGAPPPWWRLILAIVIYVSAWPLSIACLRLLPFPHDNDLIEAFRIGTVIPFLIIGLGVLALPRAAATEPTIEAQLPQNGTTPANSTARTKGETHA